MAVEYNQRPMKILLSIIVLSFITFFNIILGQTKPTARVVSDDVTICESGNVNFTVELTGNPPFSIAYEYDGSTFKVGPTYDTQIMYNLTFNDTQNSNVILKGVYDSNYPPNGGESGDILGDGEMVVTVDKMPIVNAGDDDDICGYEYVMAGEIVGKTTSIWWTGAETTGVFDQLDSPNSKFTGNTANSYLLKLNVKNGTCSASDEVNITLKGRPQGEITNDDVVNFCSSDEVIDNIEINTSFTGVAPFTYRIKNADGTSPYRSFTADNLTNVENLIVTQSETISFLSIEDAQGCLASSEEMLGVLHVNDVKPLVFAGDDAINCGSSYSLNARVTPNTTGKWTTSYTESTISDDDLFNTNTTISFNSDDVYRDIIYKWTETTTDEFKCVDADEVMVKYVKKPTFTLNSAPSDNICDGGSSFAQYSLTGATPLSIDYRNEEDVYVIDDINSLTGNVELTPSFSISEGGEDGNSKEEYVFIKITDDFNCITEINQEYSVIVDEMPVVYAGDDDEVCSRTIQLDADVPTVGIGYWTGEGTFEDENNALTNFVAHSSDKNPGEAQTLKWTVVNGKCSTSDEVDINFHKAPYPINAGNDTTIYAIDHVKLNAVQPDEGNSYTWTWLGDKKATFNSPDDPNTIVSNLKTGKYTLLWTVSVIEGDCPDKTDTVTVIVNDLLTPTGISPNGDGVNDYLKIKGADNIKNDRLTIFNKYGKKVFSADEYENDWDGKDLSGASLPSGTYFYVYEGEDITPIKNYLIIKR